MTTTSFTTSFVVDQSANEVFNAINNVRGWWSEQISGRTSQLNDEFHYQYQDVHACKIKLVEVIPDEKVVWLVMENFFNFTKDNSEWTDTMISFEIIAKGNKTELHFTHHGLVPEYECYEICQDGWNNYINLSLRNLIVKGQGQPNPKEGGFNEALLREHKLNKNQA